MAAGNRDTRRCGKAVGRHSRCEDVDVVLSRSSLEKPRPLRKMGADLVSHPGENSTAIVRARKFLCDEVRERDLPAPEMPVKQQGKAMIM